MPSPISAHEKKFNLVERWRPVFEQCAVMRADFDRAFESPEGAAEWFMARIHSIERDAAGAGRRLAELNREAIYAVVAIIDEIGKTCPSGRVQDYWYRNELELEFFKTSDAGTAFFDKIDGLIKRNLPEETDLRIIYYKALTLGFRGRFQDEPARIQERARELLNSIERAREVSQLKLTPEAYDHVYRGKDPRLRTRWAMVALIMILIATPITIIVFYQIVTGEMRSIIDTFEQIAPPPK